MSDLEERARVTEERLAALDLNLPGVRDMARKNRIAIQLIIGALVVEHALVLGAILIWTVLR